MRNPNTKPVLTLDEKRDVSGPRPGLYHPMVVQSYDEHTDTFTIANDERYMCNPELDGMNCDTDFYDLDDATIPAYMIHAVIGADTDHEDPWGYVGHQFLMPGAAVNAA